MVPLTRFLCESWRLPSPTPLHLHQRASGGHLPSLKGLPYFAWTFLNHRFQQDEACFIKCHGVKETWGPETGGGNPPLPSTFDLLRSSPSLIPGPDSVDICAIAHPGGNQIIFKPEIIFFIIVTDSIFFLFSVTRCVCTYIIYIINIKEIIYLSWDGKTREGYIDTYIYKEGDFILPFP